MLTAAEYDNKNTIKTQLLNDNSPIDEHRKLFRPRGSSKEKHDQHKQDWQKLQWQTMKNKKYSAAITNNGANQITSIETQ